MLNKLNEDLPPEFLKNIIIGVEVDSTTRKGLKKLADDSNGQFFDVSDSDIETIFQRFSLSLGIVTRTAIVGFDDGERQGMIAA